MSSIRYDTIWPADSVEFCPIDGYRNFFCCGTYKLFEADQSTNNNVLAAEIQQRTPTAQHRRGTCRLYQISQGDRLECELKHELSLAAIPDLKWCHKILKGNPLLAAADSEGGINLMTLEDKQLKLHHRLAYIAKEVLVLSLDWQVFGPVSNEINISEKLTASCSNGDVLVLGGDMQILHQWQAHDFESWITACDRHNSSVIYTGGDDCKWKAWDIRLSPSLPVFVNKSFEAGVTSIQSHPYKEHTIGLGSYDGMVRIFDTRNPQTSLELIPVSGGVWRLKWHPSSHRKRDLLTACMHDGFKVLKTASLFSSDGDDEKKITKRFDMHTSLAYGVDWAFDPDSEENKNSLIASCSFYDHSLYLWKG